MKWYIKCLKQYVDFEGRARRKEYWWFILINFIITLILFICWLAPTFKMGFEAAASGNTDFDPQEAIPTILKNPFMYIYILYYMAMLIPGIAVLVRRLHDIGKSGFWAFFILGGSLLGNIASIFQTTNVGLYLGLALASLVICIISLVWMFTDSQYGPNKYGPNPKGEGNTEAPVEE